MLRRIAIIGGGAAAAAALSELVDRAAPSGLSVDWFTGGATHPGRGSAYDTVSPRHLLNVRAASMGMFTGRPQGFLDFARRRDPKVAGTDFLPRSLYGDYLEAEVERTLEQARSRAIDIRKVPVAIDALVPEGDGVTVLHGATGTRVDGAVLALGHLPPGPLEGVDGAAVAAGRYVVEPWTWLASAATQPPPREVLVIGAGLTAVDVVLELTARWPQARVTLLSRHGCLPAAHLADASPPDDDGVDLAEALREAPEVRRWLRLVREAVDGAADWRTVIDGLRPHTPALWASLPMSERARFLRHVRGTWERSRHRMAPQVAGQLEALQAAGRLLRRTGWLQRVALHDQALQVDIVHRGQERAVAMTADLVIQTIGANADVRHTGHPLVRQLTTNGYVSPDPLGLGWEALPDGRLCREGRPWERLFALGALLRGTLWECTAMPEIRKLARTIARQLLATGG